MFKQINRISMLKVYPFKIYSRSQVLFFLRSLKKRLVVVLKILTFLRNASFIEAFSVFSTVKKNYQPRFSHLMIKGGIYMFFNKINKKSYIGSTINLPRRFIHHISGVSSNKVLQSAFKKYGFSNFFFVVLELVNREKELLLREQFFLNLFKPDYNLSPTAGSCLGIKRPEDWRLHRREIWTSKYGKRVFLFDILSEEILEFPSKTSVARFIGGTPKDVYSGVKRGNLVKNRYLLVLKKEQGIKLLSERRWEKHKNRRKPVSILDTVSNEVFNLPTMSAAASYLNCHLSSVQNALKKQFLIKKRFRVFRL